MGIVPKILVLGKHGQLGWELWRTLAPLGPVTAIDYEDMDLTDPAALRDTLRRLAPNLIVNAAAYTDVDKAETEVERCRAVNATAPGVLAEESKRLGAGLIHYSTDYVFDGEKGKPYTEADAPNPINEYGRSKLAGDQAVTAVDGAYLILRTAWVYSRRGRNFVTKTLEWSRQMKTLRIVDDQISSPTWARLLAETTALILAQAPTSMASWFAEHKGLYHLVGGGQASRLEWARAILALDPRRGEQIVEEILPASSGDFPTPARRPRLSALDCTLFEKTFGLHPVDWRVGLGLSLSND